MHTTPAAPAVPSLIFRPLDYFARLDLGRLFPTPRPLEVELGAGDGSFLLQWASAHPERSFLGVERLLGRLRKIDRKGRRAGLTNLLALRIEALYLVEWLLPNASVAAFHIYFPDPWPKRKHRRHRLINEHFTAVAAQALRPGGRVFLRTDDGDYFEQMQAVFAANSDFCPIETPPDLQAVQTDFEREFIAKGILTRHAAFAKDSSRP